MTPQARRLNAANPEDDMDVEFKKIEEAYEFVSAGPLYSHRALLDTTTGEVLLWSESNELDEFPEVVDEARYLELPTRSELHLGKTLVISFVESHIPEALAEVLEMFASRGPYPRFKKFLDRHNLVDQWYEFEGKETERALREWCRGKGLSLTG